MNQPVEGMLPDKPKSYWLDSTSDTSYSSLEEDIDVDVAIVGGGLAGISTAWFLKQEGIKVAVLEADKIGAATTGHSTAKITSQHDLIYAHIWEEFGQELARQYSEANETAVRVMAEIIKENGIECDYQEKSAYVYTQEDKYIDKIQKEAETAEKLGIRADYLDRLDLPFAVKAAVRFRGQAQFHPRKYVLALAERIQGDGCYIFENTPAVAIEEGKSKTVLLKNGKRVTAEKLVIASHFPFHDGLGLYFARMYPDRSYILGVKTHDKLPDGMYVTAESPGRSLRTQKDGDTELLLVAGEHHKTAQGEPEDNHYRNLSAFAQSAYKVLDIPYKWSTQDYSTIDKIPYIGKIRSGSTNIFVATGFRKWGISSSTVSALLIRDLIVKGQSPWQDVYSPQRAIKLSSAGKLVSINADVAKYLISGKLSRTIPGSLQPGEGRIMEIDGRKVGAYREVSGQFHAVDPTCTHLGCELEWNSGEKSWDCPCHGSRFSHEGIILEGPALKPLQYYRENNDIDPDII